MIIKTSLLSRVMQSIGLLVVVTLITPGSLLSQEAGQSGDQAAYAFFSSASGSNSFLGVGVREITAERAKQRSLPEERGVELTSIAKDSPAEKAGMREGDIVLEYNGQRVQGVEQFVRLVRETPIGRTVSIEITRDGSTETLKAIIGSNENRGFIIRPGPDRAINIPRFTLPEIRVPDVPRVYTAWRSSRLGIEAETLESQLADYFGVEKGVLVRSVVPESAAEEAGLRAGDVIIRIGDKEVTSPREVTSAIRETEEESFPVIIIREKRERTLTVTMTEEQQGQRLQRGRFVMDAGTQL